MKSFHCALWNSRSVVNKIPWILNFSEHSLHLLYSNGNLGFPWESCFPYSISQVVGGFLLLLLVFLPQSSYIWNWRLETCPSNHSLLLRTILLNPMVSCSSHLAWLTVSIWQSWFFFFETFLHLASSTPHSPDFPSVSLAIPSQSPLLVPPSISNKLHIRVSHGSVLRSLHYPISCSWWFCLVSWI